MNEIKALSVWGTDSNTLYGVLFDPIKNEFQDSTCAIETTHGNIVAIDTKLLTNKVAEFSDFDLFSEYVNSLISKKQE